MKHNKIHRPGVEYREDKVTPLIQHIPVANFLGLFLYCEYIVLV